MWIIPMDPPLQIIKHSPRLVKVIISSLVIDVLLLNKEAIKNNPSIFIIKKFILCEHFM